MLFVKQERGEKQEQSTTERVNDQFSVSEFSVLSPHQLLTELTIIWQFFIS